MNHGKQNTKIAVFGSAGSFTEQAAISKFGQVKVTYKYFENIFSLLDYLQNHEECIGVIPFSNNNVGHVEMTQNLLANYSYEIVTRIKLKVDLFLFVKKDIELRSIHAVASHPHALLQCRKFIAEKLPDASVISAASTSHAAMYLKHNKYDNETAVITSEKAGNQFGLKKVLSKIQDNESNYTEFIVIKVPE